MITKNKFILILFFLFLALVFLPGEATKKVNDINLDWQDLKNLLNLNADNIKITWPQFKRLIRQTGHKIEMDFKLNDGIVTLKREKFKKILNQLIAISPKLPFYPTSYLINEANYSAQVDKNHIRFKADFNIYVFEKKKPSFVMIPILFGDVALINITIDNVPAVIKNKGNWYHISIFKSGFHRINAEFSISPKKQHLSLAIVRSIINRINFTLPKRNANIIMNPSINPKLEYKGDKTSLTGNFPPANRINISWSQQVKQKEKKPAVFYTKTDSLIAVDSDIVKTTTDIDLEIIQSSLNNISIKVPKSREVVKVEAGEGSIWQVREVDIGKVLEISFGYDIKSNHSFTVYTEQILAAQTSMVTFTGLEVIDARRERGNLGIVASSAVEVEAQESQGLEKIVFHKLPRSILNMSSRPILFAFKYQSHPFYCNIDINKNEQLKGISTIVESVENTVLFLSEGKMISRVEYKIKNSFKQFMEIDLPDEAVIWTVLVDNKREKASRNKEGKILIPLLRSTGNGIKLKSFLIELIYTLPVESFGLRGNMHYLTPVCDVFTNKIMLSLFLPKGYNYSISRREWKEHEKSKKQITDFEYKKREKKMISDKLLELTKIPKDISEEGVIVSADADVSDMQIISKRELSKSEMTGPVGLKSVKVQLPVSGEIFTFSKAIINPGDKNSIQFSYFKKSFKQILIGIFLLLVLVILTLYIYYKKRR